MQMTHMPLPAAGEHSKRLAVANRRAFSCTWSMAWLAPASRSSHGRSAVSTMTGTRLWLASTTAGSRLATAVPDEVMMTAGILFKHAH